MIDNFRDDYFFLSNFYPAKITYDGITYLNNEAAFQAQKTLNLNLRESFCNLNPSDAKRKGRRVSLRTDWEFVKDKIMYDICLCKFIQNSDIKNKLIETGNEELVEGTTWKDQYWGVYNGVGENHLGKILMNIRENINDKDIIKTCNTNSINYKKQSEAYARMANQESEDMKKTIQALERWRKE